MPTRAGFKAAFEDIRTIRKAQAESATLAKVNEAQALNQAVRWINTKEEHAARYKHLPSWPRCSQRGARRFQARVASAAANDKTTSQGDCAAE